MKVGYKVRFEGPCGDYHTGVIVGFHRESGSALVELDDNSLDNRHTAWNIKETIENPMFERKPGHGYWYRPLQGVELLVFNKSTISNKLVQMYGE